MKKILLALTIVFLMNTSYITNSYIYVNPDNSYSSNVNSRGNSNYLEIKSIALKEKIYERNNKKNNVRYGLEIIDSSVYPGEVGIVIIASHSGRGKNAYFNNLHKMKVNDKALIKYNNKNYTYTYYKNDIQKKNGKLSIEYDGCTKLILITCTHGRLKTHQSIYYFK